MSEPKPISIEALLAAISGTSKLPEGVFVLDMTGGALPDFLQQITPNEKIVEGLRQMQEGVFTEVETTGEQPPATLGKLADTIGKAAKVRKEPTPERKAEIDKARVKAGLEPMFGTVFSAPSAPVNTSEPTLSINSSKDNGVLMTEANVRVVHISDPDRRNTGMTIAYRNRIRHNGEDGDVIEVSTAVVHPTDQFCKKTGTRVAVQNFMDGRTIDIRRIEGMDTVTTIKMFFYASLAEPVQG